MTEWICSEALDCREEWVFCGGLWGSGRIFDEAVRSYLNDGDEKCRSLFLTVRIYVPGGALNLCRVISGGRKDPFGNST